MHKSLLIAAIASIALAGCAAFTPPVDVAEKPSGNEAYLYGRFEIATGKIPLALNGHQTIGFALRCDDNAYYLLRFNRENAVQAIKVKPGSCRFFEIVFTNADGQILKRNTMPEKVAAPRTYVAGQAYYLGDYFATSGVVTGYGAREMSWAVRRVVNDYQRTTNELHQNFPKLAAVPTHDRMLGEE